MTLLATEGLTKRYGGLLANDGVAMALEPGEIRGCLLMSMVHGLFGERGREA